MNIEFECVIKPILDISLCLQLENDNINNSLLCMERIQIHL